MNQNSQAGEGPLERPVRPACWEFAMDFLGEPEAPQVEAYVSDLEHENRVLSIKAGSSLANNLCPDHRDKQKGKRCLACEIERMKNALQRITHFTSATPSLSESGCGRLLAQIEHEAMKALDAEARTLTRVRSNDS